MPLLINQRRAFFLRLHREDESLLPSRLRLIFSQNILSDMGQCCSSIPTFFHKLQDLKRKMKEVKSELGHVERMLEGVLQIFDDMRPVASEFKGLVCLYTRDSRMLLREHLEQHLKPAGRERLYHRDFKIYFRRELDARCQTFLDVSSDLQGKVALKEVLRTLTVIIRQYKERYSDDIIKIEALCSLEFVIVEAYDLHIEEQVPQSTADDTCCEIDGNQLEQEVSQQSIRLFCRKQKLVGAIEKIIHQHFQVFQEECSRSERQKILIQYRQQSAEYQSVLTHYDYRNSTLLKWRRLLSKLLRTKKIGSSNKEELNFRIRLNVESAALHVWNVEQTIKPVCVRATESLKWFASQRHESDVGIWINEFLQRWRCSEQHKQESNSEDVKGFKGNDSVFCHGDRMLPYWNYKQIYDDLNSIITLLLDYISTRAVDAFAKSFDPQSVVADKLLGVAQAIDCVLTNPVEILSMLPDNKISDVVLDAISMELNCAELVVIKNFLKICKDSPHCRDKLAAILREQLGETGVLSRASRQHIMEIIEEKACIMLAAVHKVVVEHFETAYDLDGQRRNEDIEGISSTMESIKDATLSEHVASTSNFNMEE